MLLTRDGLDLCPRLMHGRRGESWSWSRWGALDDVMVLTTPSVSPVAWAGVRTQWPFVGCLRHGSVWSVPARHASVISRSSTLAVCQLCPHFCPQPVR